MRRREFVKIAATAIALPIAAHAQQRADVPQLCVLAADSLSSPWATRYAGFIKGLGDLGYVQGHNISINFLNFDAAKFQAMVAAGTPPDIWRTQAPLVPQWAKRGESDQNQQRRAAQDACGPIVAQRHEEI